VAEEEKNEYPQLYIDGHAMADVREGKNKSKEK